MPFNYKKKLLLFGRGNLVFQDPAFSLATQQADGPKITNAFVCISSSTSLATPHYHNSSVFFFLTCLLAAARAIQQFPSPIFTRVQILLSSHGSCFSLACSLISCHHSLLCPTTGSCCTGGDEQEHGEGKADTKGCAFKGAANNFEFLGINRSILL